MALTSHLVDWLARNLSIYWQVRVPPLLAMVDWRGVKSVLDVGCGRGLVASYLASKQLFVVGVDFNSSSLTEANHRSQALGRRRVSWLAASGTSLPLRSDSFDVVVCMDVLDDIPDDRGALRELVRVLKPGGVCLITEILKDRRFHFHPIYFPEDVHEYSEEALLEIVNASGLQVVERFYFYRSFSTLAREIEAVLVQIPLLIWRPLRLIWLAPLVLMAKLDFLDRGRGGGIGIMAKKPSLP